MIAMNDSFPLESTIYELVNTHSTHTEPYYIDLVDLLHEATYQTEMGQLIDLITASEGAIDLSKSSFIVDGDGNFNSRGRHRDGH